ncbi:L-asparaginase 3 like protein [Verticillium longisporum]|nr:L-asparaginase 3 like protein [Verticillium longisporum]
MFHSRHRWSCHHKRSSPTPIAIAPQDANELRVVHQQVSHKHHLPNVTIFATGGTIAATAASAAVTMGYKSGDIGIEALIDVVPQIRTVANIQGIQVMNIDSTEVTAKDMISLARRVQQEVSSPHCDGLVITHGTDTLEESAFFVDLTVQTDKPIVFVGAMRPATVISADGPLNLLEAVTLAASPKARGRGVLVTLNDRIGSAFLTSKMHANSVDAFRASEGGYLGFFFDVQPRFFYAPSLPLGRHYFKAAVKMGAKGLVLAGPGYGTWRKAGRMENARLVEQYNTQIVTASQNGDGFAISQGGRNNYGAGHLNPRKARIMLQLGLAQGYDSEKLEKLFSFDC